MEYLAHIDLVTDDKASQVALTQLEEAPLDVINVNCEDFFKFYNLSHLGAPFVLIILLIIPPLLDLYMEIVVAESVHGTSHD